MQTLHMIPYADTYAAMLVSGYISGPVCRMLSMRTRMQMRVYSGKVWTNIENYANMYVYGSVYIHCN